MTIRSNSVPASRRPRPWLRTLAGVLVAGMLAPAAAAQLPGVFNALFGLIENDIGGSLAAVDRIAGQSVSLWEATVAPLGAINQARGFVAGSIGRLHGTFGRTLHTPLASAVTPGPARLESILESGQAGEIPSLGTSFAAGYGAVPAARAASGEDRLMMDVDDALSQESLKTALIADQGADLVLQTAEAMESQAAVSAPGSAPLLTAQAGVANLRCQAYLQRMLAAELREEAGRLAHDNALIKRRAGAAGRVGALIGGAPAAR